LRSFGFAKLRLGFSRWLLFSLNWVLAAAALLAQAEAEEN
jgi:uncharacterized membrane protein